VKVAAESTAGYWFEAVVVVVVMSRCLALKVQSIVFRL
jgi:hypothetical protein